MNQQNQINMYDPTRDYKTHEQEYIENIKTVLNHGKFINGPEVKELEGQLEQYVAINYCICVGNGTDALQIALMALGVGYGDEVITVSFTWISTAEVISIIGAKPVFVDVEDKYFCMDPSKLEEKITKNTKAIIFVSLYGQIGNIEQVKMIADKHDIPLIEDGAQSFGASKDGYRSCGTFSTIATTSFFPTKPLGCYGDGGACFTNSKQLAIKMRAIKNHGALKRFNHFCIGMNSRLDSIQAAILLKKLDHFNETLDNRNRVADFYNSHLCHIKYIKLPKTDKRNYHVWAQYTIIVPTKEIRDSLLVELKKNGVNVSVFYPSPLHKQPCFEYDVSLEVTERLCDTVINLPCYGELKTDELERICKTFEKSLNIITN